MAKNPHILDLIFFPQLLFLIMKLSQRISPKAEGQGQVWWKGLVANGVKVTAVQVCNERVQQ